MDNFRITFGIITSSGSNNHLCKIIESIRKQGIPQNSYEIIIVGSCGIQDELNLRVIPFDENKRGMWITRKKNIITSEAKYENIVYMHDYLSFADDWYNEFIMFGTDWDICMNSIINTDGTRILDWMGLPDDPIYGNVLLPYGYEGSDGMYIPGNYWVAKKSVMLEFPLNEDFTWGEGEDIEWSKRVIGGFPPLWLKNRSDFISGLFTIKKHKYVVNSKSKVFSLKYKSFHPNFFLEYDMHSGNEARPLESTKENYKFLGFR